MKCMRANTCMEERVGNDNYELPVPIKLKMVHTKKQGHV